MSLLRLVIKSFRHYFTSHLAVATGIAISTAIIVGGLIVGDSVSYSLMQTARDRTGDVTHLVRAGERIFTRELAGKMDGGNDFRATPVMRLEGIGVADGGLLRLNRIQVWGLDPGFGEVAGPLPGLDSLGPGECILSENMAGRLGLVRGDRFLLRIRKASQVPANAPFVSEKIQAVSVRVLVKGLAGRNGMGYLNMHASQTAPYNVFLSLDWLNRLMGTEGQCNLVLVSGDQIPVRTVKNSIRENWTARDAGLDLKYLEGPDEWKISTKRVFIDPASSVHLKTILPGARPVLTYFANSIGAGSRSTPYSFISTTESATTGEDEIELNDWLAEDLGIGAGDTVTVRYFVIGPLRRLTETEKKFAVKRVIPLQERFGDRELVPFIPGLSDAGSCGEWEAGVPVDLQQIRRKDEEYWNAYRGTPKAYISLAEAERLWQNRFGDYTSFRVPADAMNDLIGPELSRGSDPGDPEIIRDIEKALVADLDPGEIGFEVIAVQDEAIRAAANGVDFSQLFLGLSFFILVSGMILTVLLLNHNLMQRSPQNGTLSALGFSGKLIRKMVILENSMSALTGTFLGAILAILYTKLVFSGLNRVWYDIVRMQVLEVQVKTGTILTGMIISLGLALITITLSTRRMLGRQTALVQKGLEPSLGRSFRILLLICACTLPLVSFGLVLRQFFGQGILVPGIFFMAGGLLLISLLLFSEIVLRRIHGRARAGFSFSGLRNRNLAYKRGRSMTIIILLALGTFLVISTGANRKDDLPGSVQKSSGTGGFLFFAESTVPVLSDLNDPVTKMEEGLTQDFSLVQFRVSEGDDASCLNLNRVSNPRIISTDPSRLEGRFRFATAMHSLDAENPWESLEAEIAGAVPAVADQTVIQWGLGMKVGDTLVYMNEMGDPLKLLLVGGLAPSVFQGNVIISERQFLKHFPSSSGSNIFLVEGDPGNSEAIASDLNATFRDHGWEMQAAAQRLAEFNSVSNTYLSIFLIMGTFGLIIGTVGLAIVLVRSIREQRYDVALLSAAGFSRRKINKLLAGGYAILLITGVAGGLLTAIVATLPVFLSPGREVSLPFISGLTAAILINGLAWIWLLSRHRIRKMKIIEDLRNE